LSTLKEKPMAKITGKLVAGTEMAKRFDLPGLKLEEDCPECGNHVVKDFKDALSYPIVGQPEQVYLYCNECEHEWPVSIIIDIAVSLVDPKKEIQDRLEYLRGEIVAEQISMEEIAELQSLSDSIDPSDVMLREWAGMPE
jgi:hypothetical protein